MSKRNRAVALLIVFYLLFFTVFGPFIAPFSLDHSVTVFDYEGTRFYSPFPPNRVYLLGTDIWGYDLASRILHGFRYTVFAVVILAGGRVAIGALAGTVAGYRGFGRRVRRAPFAIPAFIIVYFVSFRVSIGSPLSIWSLMVLQGSLIVLVGLPGTIGTFAEETQTIMHHEYIQAARGVGAGPWRIIRRHIFPQLIDLFGQQFTGEAVSVLALLGQLAMFNVFFGGTIVSYDPILYHSRTNELAGMVGQYREYLTTNQWLLLAPLTVYLSILVSFFVLSRLATHSSRAKRARYL